jgi:hypothetical protein
MWHLAHQHEVGVDPCAAIVKPSGRRHALADVGGPHRRGEPVVAVVGPGRLVNVVKARHRDDGTEHSFAYGA